MSNLVKTSFQSNIGELPILKHFSESELQKNVNSFRKGEKGLYSILKLVLFGGLAYMSWVYILPPVFKMLGQFLAIASTGVAIVGFVILIPTILKGIKAFTRTLHKVIINNDPFLQLETEREKMVNSLNTVRVSVGKISKIKNEMEEESMKSEKEAENGQKKILSLRNKADSLKNEIDNLIKNGGIEVKQDDEYISLSTEFQKILAEATRLSNKFEQDKIFIQKYGTRAVVMKKVLQKLKNVDTVMEIKIGDFDATVDILKKEYSFAQKANDATSAAKSVLGLNKSWELDYALDVITSTISADIAMTTGNLKDIDSLTSNYNLDSDEMFNSLNAISDKILIGNETIPSSKSYNNPDYKFTQTDRLNSNGLTEIF